MKQTYKNAEKQYFNLQNIVGGEQQNLGQEKGEISLDQFNKKRKGKKVLINQRSNLKKIRQKINMYLSYQQLIYTFKTH